MAVEYSTIPEISPQELLFILSPVSLLRNGFRLALIPSVVALTSGPDAETRKKSRFTPSPSEWAYRRGEHCGAEDANANSSVANCSRTQ